MGERGPEKGQAFGAASITKCLKDVDFPCSKDQLISSYGDCEIEFKKGEPMMLRDILENIPDETYNSPADLEHAVHESMK